MFTKTIPETVGISSQNILDFLHELEEYNICMHSMLLIRHDKLIAETYYAPYTAITLHRMFSVTKSFTALAIGLLSEEGKLDLNDRIIDHFPEKLPKKVHPYIEQITIKDMLIMATAHERTTFKRSNDPDWVRSFFVVEPSHLPGTIFSYDTSSSHTLAALVEKLSGMSLLDYLRTKFLDKLDFSPHAYITTDPMGIATGGSGLMATPMDLAKVAWLVMRNGQYQGETLLPPQFLAAATSKQIDTSVRGGNIDEKQGYGYQFWRVRNNGYAMFGMGGQLAVCFPDYDLLLITTADTQENPCGVPTIFDAFFNNILANIANEPLKQDVFAYSQLEKELAESEIKPLVGRENQDLVAKINQQTYEIDPNSMGLEQLRFEFSDAQCQFHFTNKNGSQKLKFGMEELVIDQFPHYNFKCATSAAWISEQTLILKSNIIDEELGMITMQFVFSDDTITVLFKKVIGMGFHEFAGFASGKLS